MQNDYFSLTGTSVVFTDTKEQLIECDLVLPDYYPEINRVLKCSVSVSIEDVTLSGDKISAAGRADVRLTYLDGDDRIRIFSSLSKYTRVFTGNDLRSDDSCFVTQTVTGTEYRATAPRKCEIRASAAVKVLCIRRTECNAFAGTDAPDAELRTESLPCFSANAFRHFELAFHETVDLPAGGSKPTGVLCTSQQLSFTENKVIKNKVMLKGSCDIRIRFTAEDGSLPPEVSYTLPFTEIAAFPGAEENDECILCTDSVNARVAADDGGKTAQIFVSARVRAVCGTRKELRLPDDVYSVRDETEIKRETCRLLTDIVPAVRQFRITSDAECYDETADSVEAFYTDAPVCEMIAYNGTMHINGSVGVNFIVRGTDGSPSLVCRSCNFDEDTGIEAGGSGFIDCRAEVESASLKNGRIGYTLRLEVSGCLVRTADKALITDVVFRKSADKNGNAEKIVLYYAHPGERIWDIAKENGCSAGRLREYNDFEGETVENEMMLVLVK